MGTVPEQYKVELEDDSSHRGTTHHVKNRSFESEESGPSAWSLLAVGNTRYFKGNDGYDDVLDTSYSYDSTVPNHAKLLQGDTIVVRSNTRAVGVGVIEHIEIAKNVSKKRSRCPNCQKTGFKERKLEIPRFRCYKCKSTFDSPNEETIFVTTYRADYGSTWRSLEGRLDKTDLEALCVARAKQQSIRRLFPEKLKDALTARGIGLGTIPGTASALPSIPGGRKKSLVSVRTGQQAYRKALIARHGFICAITGPAPAEALEAAHLRAFAQTEQHLVEDGLMLRVDIHRLFDRGLLSIDPGTMTVCVSPVLIHYPSYGDLHGNPLAIGPELYPPKQTLDDHHRIAWASW